MSVRTHASTWDPTLLVNSESYLTIDDGDGSSSISIEFGSSLQYLRYDPTVSRFEFNQSLHVSDSVSVAGTASGTTATISSLPNCDTLVTTASGVVACGGSSAVQTITSVATTGTTFDALMSSGSIIRHRFDGIVGTTIVSLTSNGNYPNNPTIADTLTTFEIPTDAADNYGTRVFGYVIAPQTGNYRFWIASDDNGQLSLSTDTNPANASVIATVGDWTSPREWTKFSSQQSALIPLVAGQAYYIEALMKEGVVLDNMAVRWQLPNATYEEPIPGSRMAPYITAGTDTQSVSADTNVALVNTASGDIRLLLPSYAGEVRTIVVKKTTTDSNLIYLQPSGSELINGASSYTISASARTSITLQTDGTNMTIVDVFSG